MEANLVLEGFKFMLLGMGTVFLFLILMIVLMNVQSKIISGFFPEPQASEPSAGTGESCGTDKKKVAAITAAILHHTQAKR
jgi:oxaloacetate decarboxylase gamma subunit